MLEKPDLNSYIISAREKRLSAYKAVPNDVGDHANIEEQAAVGGYARRQVHELIQNALDAAVVGNTKDGKIEVHFDGSILYVANTGEAFDEDGINALLLGNSSPKRGEEIGRFGVGFKSITQITDKPSVWSAGFNFEFDRPRSTTDIANATNKAHSRSPLLRIAYPADLPSRDADPVLHDLMSRATTVVRVPLKNDLAKDDVRHELETFDGRFLLFTNGSIQFRLKRSDGRQPIEKTWEVKADGNNVTLKCDHDEQFWFRVSRRVSIPADRKDELQRDTGTKHARDSYLIHWATPLDNRVKIGHLWLFFPMDQLSGIPGILNAPWKTDESRQKVLDGPFNKWLLGEAAELVASNIHKLSQPEDPGVVLDYFPSIFEDRDSTRSHLGKQLLKRLRDKDIVPDQDGEPRKAKDLKLYPKAVIASKGRDRIIATWMKHATKIKTPWLHPSGANTDRQSRVRRVVENENSKNKSDGPRRLINWLSEMDVHKKEGSIAVIKLMKELSKEKIEGMDNDQLKEYVCTNLSCILCKDKVPRVANKAKLVICGGNGDIPEDSVQREVAEEMEFVLTEWPFEMKCDDRRQTVESVLKRIKSLANRENWSIDKDEIKSESNISGKHLDWIAVLPEKERLTLLSTARQESIRLPLLTAEKQWQQSPKVPPPSCWPEGKRIIDDGCPLGDEELEMLCKWLPSETLPRGKDDERYFPQRREKYKDVVWRRVKKSKDPVPDDYPIIKIESSATQNLPKTTNFQVKVSQAPLPTPYIDLPSTPSWLLESAVRFLFAWICERWPIDLLDAEHDKFGLAKTHHPVLAQLVTAGRIRWAGFQVPFYEFALAVRSEVTSFLFKEAPKWSEENWPDNAREVLCAIVDEAAEIYGDWTSGLGLTSAETLALLFELVLHHPDEEVRHCFYVTAIRTAKLTGDEILRIDGVDIALRKVVIGAPDTPRQNSTEVWLVLEDETVRRRAIEVGRARAPTDLAAWARHSGDCEPLILSAGDVTLGGVGVPVQHRAIRVRVADKWTLIDSDEQELAPIIDVWLAPRHDTDSSVVFMTTSQFERCRKGDLEAIQVFGRLLDMHAEEPTASSDIHSIKRELDARRLRRADTLADKLRAIMGDHLNELAELSQDLKSLEIEEDELAEVIIDSLGAQVFRKDAVVARLKDIGLEAPKRWGHNRKTRSLAVELGVDIEDLVGPRSSQKAEIDVPAVRELHKLRPYQHKIVEKLVKILTGECPKKRCMVSLPTGGGKTRIAVEALILALSKQEKPKPVLWIAQSGELLDQAVATFRDAWMVLGDKGKERRRSLRVSKVWGGMRPSLSLPDPTRPHVVVASIQSVYSRLVRTDGDWLLDAGAVVIDEAHHATTKSYRKMQEWLPNLSETKIIGLTATPMRSNGETQDLIEQFNDFLLPDDTETTLEYLIDKKVLSNYEIKPLNYKVEFELTERQSRDLQKFHKIPEDVLSAIGAIEDYNNVITRHVLELPEGARVLVFCCSVKQARQLALKISSEGRRANRKLRAAHIDGETPSFERARRIGEFRAGEIQILTSVNVLTTGFDAPKVDTIVVARPTLSQVLYLQMVGRGLRGPESGGTENCLIINAIGNIKNWGLEKLSYEDALEAWRAPPKQTAADAPTSSDG